MLGAFCWIWASVRQQQLSCPARSWECAVVAVQALGLGTQEAPAGSGRSWGVREAGQSPLPALPGSSSQRAQSCLEELWGFRNGGAWESLTQLHVESSCGCRRISQEGVGMWF